MSIKHDFILTLKEWIGFGPKNILVVADYLFTQELDPVGPAEYYDIISSLLLAGKLSRVKTMPAVSAFRNAYSNAVRLIRTFAAGRHAHFRCPEAPSA